MIAQLSAIFAQSQRKISYQKANTAVVAIAIGIDLANRAIPVNHFPAVGVIIAAVFASYHIIIAVIAIVAIHILFPVIITTFTAGSKVFIIAFGAFHARGTHALIGTLCAANAQVIFLAITVEAA